jgi:hypothetical protein
MTRTRQGDASQCEPHSSATTQVADGRSCCCGEHPNPVVVRVHVGGGGCRSRLGAGRPGSEPSGILGDPADVVAWAERRRSVGDVLEPARELEPKLDAPQQRVLHSYACALRYPEGRHARTNQSYGDAVVTLLTEIPRHPELRAAVSTLMPNLQRAARIVAIHQERGNTGPGDPFQKVVFLIAPMLAEGLWRRGGADTGAPAFDPEAVADAFLQGHRVAPIDDPGP